MMAKKRRRRKDSSQTKGSGVGTSAGGLEPPAADAPTDVSVAEVQQEQEEEQVGEGVEEVEEDEEAEEEEEEEEEMSPRIMLPPLPSELGGEANAAARAYLEDDGPFTPTIAAPGQTVLDSEMADFETPVTKKKSKYKFDLEVELPVESENIDGGQALPGGSMRPDGVMPLPELRDVGRKREREKKEMEERPPVNVEKVERGDIAAFTKLLEMDPEADSDTELFTQENYDAFSFLLGEGKPFLGLPNSYLQSGHTVLLVLCILCAFVDYPGFPLTQLPYDLREFLKTGLLVTGVINVGMAAISVPKAVELGQPWPFWAFKSLVLGGLSYNELSQVEPNKPKRKLSK